MNIVRILFLIAPLLLFACNREEAESTGEQVTENATPEVAVISPTLNLVEQLNAMYEEYFERNLELNPLRATFIGDDRWNDRLPNSLGSEHRAAQKTLWTQYLNKLRTFDISNVKGQDRLNYEMFSYNLNINLEGHEIPTYLMRINQFRSMANFFVQMGSGSSVQPFKTVKDYDNFLGRIEGFLVLRRTTAR